MNIPTIEIPSHIERYVIWDKETNKGRVFVLAGYCPDTLLYFYNLSLDLIQRIPEINPKDIICSKVNKSKWSYDFTLITAPIDGPVRNIEKFKETTWDKFDINY